MRVLLLFCAGAKKKPPGRSRRGFFSCGYGFFFSLKSAFSLLMAAFWILRQPSAV